MKKEYRFTDSGPEMRVEQRDGKNYLKAYGIVFNSDSRVLYGWFKERIKPEALDAADMTEIISKYNHDINRSLGTTWGGTLTWGKDDTGVWYEVELPDTETGREVKVLAERGDLRGSSFEFELNTDGARWLTEEVADGVTIDVREVTNIRKIYDLSPVMRPAYPKTEGMVEVYKREQRDFTGQTEEPPNPEKVKKDWLEIFSNKQ